MSTPRLALDHFLPYRLSFTANLVSDAVAHAYQALFGLRIPEWRVVAVTAESPDGITQQAIGSRTRMDKVTVSRAAKSLIARGLIARRPNAADQRSHLLVLTSEGWTLYDAVVPKALELERRIFDCFSQSELARFEAMLRKVDAIVLASGLSNGAPDAD
ncbi:MarR family winged helix-turn-helix transcriptional regulator [Sphingobium sp. MK2]|uniref:MarR family winged helix-turn-helix transcriptional regulator n=1 Tax=Sphingobium sp. MK2 TaxID=3116540 RepID=UPI0032E3616B